jgi:hypothetical protein
MQARGIAVYADIVLNHMANEAAPGLDPFYVEDDLIERAVAAPDPARVPAAPARFECPLRGSGGCDAPSLGRAGACAVCASLWPLLQAERAEVARLRALADGTEGP